MKKYFYLPFLFSLFFSSSYSQVIQSGSFRGQFGIDADTRSGYTKFGVAPTPNKADDWFSASGQHGKAVIDTTSASYYKNLLKNNKNISFAQRMSSPTYTNVDGNLWLDGLYVRYFITKTNSKDSTSFTSATNGQEPTRWRGGNTNVPAKSDLVDAYLHLRRNGGSATDSLWLFGAASILSATNNSYVDIELFSKNVSYSRSTGIFTSATGTNVHTEWLFDGGGKVTRAGDVLVSVRYQLGQKPEVEIYLWVNRYTTLFANPSAFRFGGKFINSGNSTYGYANIVPRASSVITGAGIMNASSNASRDTTHSTPWGTTKANTSWTSNYQSKQFVEIGLNLTRIGIDPSKYTSLSAISCDRYFESVIFKSGVYENNSGGCDHNDEEATLEDFAGPYELAKPAVSFNIRPVEMLTCVRLETEIAIENANCPALFNWTTADGSIVSSANDNSTIRANRRGTYTISASLAQGCPAAKTESVAILVDSTPPVASADLGMTPTGELQLLGGDTAASNKMTPFGGSKGLQWNWSGPNGFTASCQNPIIEGTWAWGSYYLVLTEARNGCKSSTTLDVSFKRAQGEQAVEMKADDIADNRVALVQNRNTNKIHLISNQSDKVNAKVAIYNTVGQLLHEKNIEFAKGYNIVELSTGNTNQLKVVVVSINNKLVLSRKIAF